MNKIWYLVEEKTKKIVGITECDHRGIPFSVAGWVTKGELIRYLKSYGYYIKDRSVVIDGSNDGNWLICSLGL